MYNNGNLKCLRRSMESISLYCHIPFCKKRCHYCHFVSSEGRLLDIGSYAQVLMNEIELTQRFSGVRFPLHSIYFGGGTPSLIPSDLYKKIFSCMQDHFQILPDAEITLEANPGTLDLTTLKEFKQIGFNRISLGVQSMLPDELVLLGRNHTVQQVNQAVDWIRAAGFENLNLDLMFALPGQNQKAWLDTLTKTAALNPEHLSIYELMIEKGTILDELICNGRLSQVEQDLAADMYEDTIDFLASAGFRQYEISNWAASRPDGLKTCRHNRQYWLNQPYLGLGTGACGFIAGFRTENTPDVDRYIQSFEQESVVDFPFNLATTNLTPVSCWDEIQETMMLGLRMTEEGVNEAAFFSRFGRDMQALFSREINDLSANGLVEWVGEPGRRSLRLTRRARAIGNRVFMEFVDLAER